MRTPYLLLIPVAWLTGCGETPQTARPATPSAPIAVTTVAAANETLPVLYEATGTVRARTSGTISARMSGYVREVKAQVGDRVREGQSLITLDARDLDVASKRAEAARAEVRAGMPEADTAIVAAKASLDLAQTTFNRMQELFRKTSISNQELDEASARLKAAQAACDMAKARRTQLDARLATVEQDVRSAEVSRTYAEVLAPFTGVIVTRSVEPGQLATPGAPLFTIEREGAFRLEASVDESRLTSVHAGQAVTVTLDGLDHPLDAHVTEILPAIDTASRAAIVRIDLPALPSLRTGLFGRATFQLGSREVLAVPAAAIRERGQVLSVFVVESGAAHSRLITVGDKHGDRVEVLSGLAVGEKTVTPIPQALNDGSLVEARQ